MFCRLQPLAEDYGEAAKPKAAGQEAEKEDVAHGAIS
jgi:hypothetical protein